MMRRLEVHPFALLLPVNDDPQMTANIRKRGVHVPIVLFEGKILDGRTRYNVAAKYKLPYETKVFQGTRSEALEEVMTLNIHRRHMEPGQRGMAAADIVQAIMDENPSAPRHEVEEAALDATGAARSTMKRCETIKRKDPGLAAEVRNGTKNVAEILTPDRFRHTCPKCKHQW